MNRLCQRPESRCLAAPGERVRQRPSRQLKDNALFASCSNGSVRCPKQQAARRRVQRHASRRLGQSTKSGASMPRPAAAGGPSHARNHVCRVMLSGPRESGLGAGAALLPAGRGLGCRYAAAPASRGVVVPPSPPSGIHAAARVLCRPPCRPGHHSRKLSCHPHPKGEYAIAASTRLRPAAARGRAIRPHSLPRAPSLSPPPSLTRSRHGPIFPKCRPKLPTSRPVSGSPQTVICELQP